MSTTPIVQFGTSRFLQAHADLFVSQAMAEGQALGPVAVVQTSGDAHRAKRLEAMTRGYEVHIRGLEHGRRIDERVPVHSVTRGLALERDLEAVRAIIAHEARIILSNTADAGFAARSQDRGRDFDMAMSYPAKLAHLLHARYEAGGAPIQVMPCELVSDNGGVLRELVRDAAHAMAPGFRDWLATQVVWVNSLVDRIVSEPLEPAGAVAEPYALWAIEDQPGLILPCKHAAIAVVPDLGPLARRKLFVLNLGHTWMVSRWLAQGRHGPRTVHDFVNDPALGAALDTLYREEVAPAFAAAGEDEGLAAYIAQTRDRFANPFLDHRLEDIAQNHAEKRARRLGAFLEWARANGDTGPKPHIEAALEEKALQA